MHCGPSRPSRAAACCGRIRITACANQQRQQLARAVSGAAVARAAVYAAGASVLFAYNYNQERNEAYFNDISQYADQVFWLGSNNARHRMTIAGTYDFPSAKASSDQHASGPERHLRRLADRAASTLTVRANSSASLRAEVVGEPYIDDPGPQSGSTRTLSAFCPPSRLARTRISIPASTDRSCGTSTGPFPSSSRSRNGTSSNSASRPTT